MEKRYNRPQTDNKQRTHRPYQRKTTYDPNRTPLDPLVLTALEFINTHADNSKVFKCFHKSKKTGMLDTFGVYNTVTKKHAIFHTTNFYEKDFVELKLVTLEVK